MERYTYIVLYFILSIFHSCKLYYVHVYKMNKKVVLQNKVLINLLVN